MSKLDIVVPAKNEAENLPKLLDRIAKALDSTNVPYQVIVVNDYSTDTTASVVTNLAKKYPVKLVNKAGLPGKAYAVLEGAAVAQAETIAMIDADLQYPPEAIPEMYNKAQIAGMVVANRKKAQTSKLRRFVSKTNRSLTGKLLLGFNCDTQSGLKVFKREIITHLQSADIFPWALDIPLLHTARELGYKIDTVDIDFAQRNSGTSHVNVMRATKQIAWGALKTKVAKQKIYKIKPIDTKTSVGAGVAFKRRRFITHSNLPHEDSAVQTITSSQKAVFYIVLGILGVCFALFPLKTAIVILGILSFVYFIDMIFSLWIVVKSLHIPPELSYTKEQLERLHPERLPMYTILCPLYKEARVLPHFIEAIDKLDWPKDKLEVLLLLEEDDHETLAAAKAMGVPKYIQPVVVPHSFPKTKPKACNYGLQIATGEYVVIYDAEDQPDADQLKKAYLGFQKSSHKVVCLQAKLNYFNPKQNLLTRLFTAEYSLWFDIVLPGYQSLNTTIPLGGTSNHFRTKILRELHGWDAFNVTEDCDLGARLFKKGYQTSLIDSTTLEEANSKWGNWLRQRSRWMKGYMQTLLVHNRQPVKFVKEHGWHAFIFQLVVGGKTLFTIINPILWLSTIAYFAAYKIVGPTIESLFPPIVFYMAAFSALFGNFLYLYYYMLGCAKRGHWELVKYVFVIPFYWLAVSVAACKALVQLLTKPHYWEKTNHGLHLKKTKADSKINEITTDLSDLFENAKKNDKKSEQSLRILILNWRDMSHKWAGGAEVYVQELAKRWVKAGHNVTIFCGNDGSQSRNKIQDGVKIIRRGGTYLVYVWAILYYIFKFRNQFDIVIDSENGIPFFTPLYVRVPKFLLIHHVHQNVFREHLKFPLAQIGVFLEAKLMPFIYRNQNIVTVSESSKVDIQNLGFASRANITIVSPGINITSFSPSLKTKYPSFVYLGRIRPYKNLDVAISAFKKLTLYQPNATLKIAGWGENISQLKNQVKNLGLNSKVQFLGRVTEEEKKLLLSSSWAMLQPSSFEGWGITVIEANACGTPVIASDVIGLRDSVIPNKTGILVPLKDIDALAMAMNRMIVDPTYRISMTNSAINWAKNFDWDQQSKRFFNVISDAYFYKPNYQIMKKKAFITQS